MVQTAGRKLLSLRIIEDDENYDCASLTFIDVHPMITFSQLRRTVADKIEAPSVDLYLQGPRTDNLPIRLEHNDAIAIAINSGDVVIAKRGQRQSDSSGCTPNTNSPFAWDGFVPTLPTATNLPGGMLDNGHAIQLKEWAQDTKEQTTEYESSVIEAAKKIRECLEERKKHRNEQISILEAHVYDLQKENRRDESVCDKAVRAMERTAREHYASVNRKLKIARTLMESIDAEVAEIIPNELSLEPFSMWTERSVSGAKRSVEGLHRNSSGGGASNRLYPQAHASPTNAINAEPLTECPPQSQWDVVLSATMSGPQFLQSLPSLSVCIVAANAFLASDEPKSVDLEETLGQGFAIHHNLGLDRDSDISTVWEREGLSPFVRNMERGHQEAIHSYESLIEGCQSAFEFCEVKPSDEATSPKVAVLLFNHYDAVLCILHSRKWFLFGIYGNAKEQQVTAYLRGFSCAADLASALVPEPSPVSESSSCDAIVYEMLPIRYVGRHEAGVKSKDGSCEEVGNMQSPHRPPLSMRLPTGQVRSVEGMGGENAAIAAVQSISSKNVKVIVTDQRQPKNVKVITDQRQPNTCSASLAKGMIEPGFDDTEPPDNGSSLPDEPCTGAASLAPRQAKMQATELRRMQVVQRCDVTKATSSNDLCVSVQLPRPAPRLDDDTGRCSVTCCAALLSSEPDRCAMCCQTVCCTCCDFYVTDIEDKPPVSPRAVCYDCAIEVVAAISSPGMSQLQAYLHKTVMETYFARLLNRASQFQNTVVAAEMKGVLSPQTRRLEEDIEYAKNRILELSSEAFLSTPEINRKGSIGLERRRHPDVGPPEGMTQEQLSILNLDATVHLIDRVSDLASLQPKKNKRKNLPIKALANALRQRCEIVKKGVASAIAGAVSTKDVNDLKRVINEIIELLESFPPALKRTVKKDLARAGTELDSCYEIVLQIQRKKTASRMKMRISSTEATLEESQAYIRALHDLSLRSLALGLEYPTRNHLEEHEQLMSSLHQRGAASRKHYFLQGKDDILALTNTLEKLEDRLLDAERHAQEAKIKQQMLEERSRLEKAHQDHRNELNALLEGNFERAFSELSTQDDGTTTSWKLLQKGSQEE